MGDDFFLRFNKDIPETSILKFIGMLNDRIFPSSGLQMKNIIIFCSRNISSDFRYIFLT